MEKRMVNTPKPTAMNDSILITTSTTYHSMPPGNTHEATRRIVLREPYAGNRHVRFDEGWKQTIIGFVHQIV